VGGKKVSKIRVVMQTYARSSAESGLVAGRSGSAWTGLSRVWLDRTGSGIGPDWVSDRVGSERFGSGLVG